MADNKQEAHIRGEPPEGVDAEVDEHGLTVLKVDESDKADPDPLHAGPKRLGLKDVPFDPNAAMRKKAGQRPGLQDSEALHPAVWVDEDSDQARKAWADHLVEDAEANLEKAKAEAKAYRKGEPA
jgi:hypothetical protein